jgi:hypothetical protein
LRTLDISDPATKDLFRDGIEHNVEFKVHIGCSGYVDVENFHDHLCDIFIPLSKNYQQIKEIANALAVLLMENRSAHLRPDTIQLLFDNRMKIIIFILNTSEIF